MTNPKRPGRPEPPTDPPPSSSIIRTVRPWLRCGQAIPASTFTVDNPDDNPALRDPIVGNWIPESGFTILDLPTAWPNGPFGANLHVEAEGFEPLDVRIILADFNEIPPDPQNANLRIQTADGVEPYPLLDYTLKPLIDLPALHPDGEGFTDARGVRWTQIGCSDFRLLARFIAGEDIGPVLDERVAIGFNQLRVFLMCGNMFDLYPQRVADYQAQLRAFCERVARAGLRLELTVLVDATVVMPVLAEQQAFFAAVCDTVRGLSYVQVELVNENDQTINVIDAAQFKKPEGILSSHGSKGVVDAARECVCVEPLWDYGTLHPDRGEDWPRKGHNIMEDIWNPYHKPGFINESCRPDQGRGPIPSDHFDAAVNMGLMGGGGTFHSQAGKDSRLFDEAERECAYAWARGAQSVDLDSRGGTYVAGHLYSPPFPVVWTEGDSVRAHGRIIGNRAWCSLPQMRKGYTPKGNDGWTITYVDGSYVECTR